ncbi:MAG: hypothetical protein K9G39_04990 [Chlorobium sp.]|uniref:hypothetical protein n=1 Tax=Chlorobium sp. TaxID=1095 RepID=UPI0025B8020D|nr:hypothetical protein [Chlorobium sp.]MCF8382940.1 hypothetical protein [Chlorobium sp.]
MKNHKEPKNILDLVVASIAIFTSIFFLSGFIYNYFFLSYFGIDVGRYFLVSDYFESSVSVIFLCLILVLWGIVPYFFGGILAQLEFVRDKRESDAIYLDPCERCRIAKEKYQIINDKYEKVMKINHIFAFVVLIYSLIIMLLTVWYGGWNAFIGEVLPFFLLILIVYILYWYFGKEKELLVNTIIPFALYPILLYMATFSSIMNAVNDYKRMGDSLSVVLERKAEVPRGKLFYLASSSRYIFFLDQQKKSIIIPREHVVYYIESSELFNPLKWIVINEDKTK